MNIVGLNKHFRKELEVERQNAISGELGDDISPLKNEWAVIDISKKNEGSIKLMVRDKQGQLNYFGGTTHQPFYMSVTRKVLNMMLKIPTRPLLRK